MDQIDRYEKAYKQAKLQRKAYKASWPSPTPHIRIYNPT
jgi:hypothetical protein